MNEKKARRQKKERRLRVKCSYPGHLHPAAVDDFAGKFNLDRANLYRLVKKMQHQIEVLTEALLGKGSFPTDSELYIDDPVPGRVYLEAGYMAVIGAVIETETVLMQAYTKGVRQFVFLGLEDNGSPYLRVDTSSDCPEDEIIIGSIEANGNVDNNPVEKHRLKNQWYDTVT
jgi:hypothetical protein